MSAIRLRLAFPDASPCELEGEPGALLHDASKHQMSVWSEQVGIRRDNLRIETWGDHGVRTVPLAEPIEALADRCEHRLTFDIYSLLRELYLTRGFLWSDLRRADVPHTSNLKNLGLLNQRAPIERALCFADKECRLSALVLLACLRAVEPALSELRALVVKTPIDAPTWSILSRDERLRIKALSHSQNGCNAAEDAAAGPKRPAAAPSLHHAKTPEPAAVALQPAPREAIGLSLSEVAGVIARIADRNNMTPQRLLRDLPMDWSALALTGASRDNWLFVFTGISDGFSEIGDGWSAIGHALALIQRELPGNAEIRKMAERVREHG